MVFKEVVLEYASFDDGSMAEFKQLLKEGLGSYKGPMGDIREAKAKKKREQTMVIRDLVTALAVCNNVTPIYPEEGGLKEFQASSPDEVALVKFAENMGMQLASRETHTV